MLIVLGFLGVAFAAFVVWLGVRIINRRERWAKRTAAGLVIAMAIYFFGAGAMLWFNARGLLPGWLRETAEGVYSPINWLYLNGPQPIRDALSWYRELWI